MLSVASFITETLKSGGAEVVFGYPGQSNLDLLTAFRKSGLRYVQACDERAAGFAACGYALSGDAPAVLCASKGPGTTNLLTPLMSAAGDGIPLLVITGNVACDLRGRRSFQEFDSVNAFLAAGAVKAARYVDAAEAIPEAMEMLCRTAWSAPCGPVLMDIACDILKAAAAQHATAPVCMRAATNELRRAEGAPFVDEVSRILEGAARPVLIVGRGATSAWRDIRLLAERLGLPTVHTVGGTGIVPRTHPMYGGLLRHNGSRAAARLVQNADVLLIVGCGLDERATGRRDRFAPQAIKIHVDVDASRLGANIHAEIKVDAHAKAFCDALLLVARRNTHWVQLEEPEAVLSPTDGPLTMGDVLGAVGEYLAGAIVVTDSGAHKYWIKDYVTAPNPSMSLSSSHFGSMGFGLPAALGAAVANPSSSVVAFCGDGGLLMTIQELGTAATCKCANLKVIVANNCGLGSTRQVERMNQTSHDERLISDFDQPFAFARIAAAFGVKGVTVSDRRHVAMLPELLRQDGPILIDCVMDVTEEKRPAISYSDPLDYLVEMDAAYAQPTPRVAPAFLRPPP